MKKLLLFLSAIVLVIGLVWAAECWQCGGTGFETCSMCQGTGSTGNCFSCDGLGIVDVSCLVCAGSGIVGSDTRCWSCKGRGYKRERCQTCRGTGKGSKCFSCNGIGWKSCPSCRGSGYSRY